jgi:chromosome segregation ATPase
MSATTNKLKYIKATDSKYADLGEEIRDLHTQSENNLTKITSVENQISNINQTVQDAINNSVTSSDNLAQELEDARGSSATLNDRLTNMELFKATQVLERLSVDRTYEYNSNGDITREIVRGQLNYDVVYSYNNGNVVKEEYYDINGVLLGTKEYE